eukprot:TRINITY_DN3856_c2_g1_i1.p1 TRINITY_DN3856_c2_g1~~TRINITY_DN3856_c2_g1_i1.p1  ORF type:complete len:818 (+),score=448.76 TRINITY_DN3856_c2_g1_i1:45-2498(+)
MPPKAAKAAAKKGPGAGAIAALKAKREKELADQKRREEEEKAEAERIAAEEAAALEAEKLRHERQQQKKEDKKANAADIAKQKKMAENKKKLEMMQKSGMKIPEAMLKKLQGEVVDEEPKKPKEKKQPETLAQKKKRLEKEKAEREKAEQKEDAEEKKADKKEDGECDDWEAEADDWENQADKEDDKAEEEEEEEEEEEHEEKEKHVDPVPAPVAAAAPVAKKEDLRSPICCVLGHVDTGKTKLLDYIRKTNVQHGEAGGITQQIGASFFPVESLLEKTKALNDALKNQLEIKVPGLLVIDTPGHESFANLRGRGSALCDIAILVVDIMHGLEPQTRESIQLLKKRKCPFVVALNKIDRLYDWEVSPHTPFPITYKKQKEYVKAEFEKRLNVVQTELAEQGLNACLYTQNKNFLKNVSLVPTSAHTGEGVPDLLLLMVQLTQRHMKERLEFSEELQCTLLEVKKIEGHGVTIDVILVNGKLREGDTIMVCGMNGPIVTTIRALLTPHPMKEIRVKGEYLHHKEIKAAQGIKIAATGLEEAVPGTPVMVVKDGDDIDEMQEQVMADLKFIHKTQGEMGVTVQASTLGALEALLEFLKDCKIPVSTVGVGTLNKKDIMRAVGIKEKQPKYAVILCFDVEVSKDAQAMADKEGIKIFTADIIYHLQDKFKAYLDEYQHKLQEANKTKAVFPCRLKIVKDLRGRDPIILGVVVEEGQVRVGTPLFAWKEKDGKKYPFKVGKVLSMEKDHKPVTVVKKGPGEFAIKIDSQGITFGRQIDASDELFSEITRDSIDALKESFKDEMTKEDWGLVIKLKKKLNIL